MLVYLYKYVYCFVALGLVCCVLTHVLICTKVGSPHTFKINKLPLKRAKAGILDDLET